MQASWKKLGVDVTIKTVDAPTLSETLFASGDWDVSAAPLGVSLPSMLVPFYSGPTPPDGTNFASVADDAYTAAVTAASSKPGAEGCADWGDAEKALYTSVSVVPYANNVLTTFGNKVTFTEGDGNRPPPRSACTSKHAENNRAGGSRWPALTATHAILIRSARSDNPWVSFLVRRGGQFVPVGVGAGHGQPSS